MHQTLYELIYHPNALESWLFFQLPAAEFPKYFLNIQKTQVGVVKQKTETVSPIGWAGLDSSRAGLVEQALLESL